MVNFINEFFFGKFTDIDRALNNPKQVRKLELLLFDDNLNDYSDQLKLFVNLNEIYLHVDVTHSEIFPEEFSELVNLKKITFLNYPLIEFPNCLLKLHKLEFLKIRGSEIDELPSFNDFVFQNLKTLEIENCELKKIPENISKLNNIENLSFAITKINSIAAIQWPKKLKKLNLAATKIDAISPANLPDSLRELNICGSLFDYEQGKTGYTDINKIESVFPKMRITKILY